MIRDPTCFICTEYLDGTYLVDHHFPRYEAVILKKSFFKFGTSEICPVSNFQHFWSHSLDNNSSSNNNNNRSEWFLRRRLTPSYFGFCVFPVCNLLSIILCTFHVCFCSLLHIFLLMTGFEPRTSGNRSDCPSNWATTTAFFFLFYSSYTSCFIGLSFCVCFTHSKSVLLCLSPPNVLLTLTFSSFLFTCDAIVPTDVVVESSSSTTTTTVTCLTCIRLTLDDNHHFKFLSLPQILTKMIFCLSILLPLQTFFVPISVSQLILDCCG